MYTPDDVAEVVPERHGGELDGKPELHRTWAEGNRGRAFEWANPGGATLTPQELATMIAGYYGMVSQLDHNIGRVLDTLDELRLADDTLVIMTTDHGELLGDHQQIFKGPLHYEGLLRIPLIARGPGVPAGAVVRDPVGTIDLAPTMLAAADLDVPAHCEGAPLPGLGGRPTGVREHTLTEDDFDVVVDIPLRTITTTRYKLTRYLADDAIGELYDLEDDPGELVNRWDDRGYASVRDDLLGLLLDAMPARGRVLPKVGLVG
jgi:arylsulfatase A-like enzyme